ncbi:MAG: hypothetical protein ACOCWO_02345, partial [Candidatus Muiribacteriaceae bacterium]
MKKILSALLIIAMSLGVMSQSIYFLPEGMNDVLGMRNRANLPARINTLLKDLEQTDSTVKDNYDRIQS